MIERVRVIINNVLHLLFLALLTYPIFYFVYKYGTPDMGMSDFYAYYYIYLELDYESLLSPHNIRLLSTFLVHLFYKTGLYYDTLIAFNDPAFSQAVYFNALLVSYLAIIFTCFAISKSVQAKVQTPLFSILVGICYMFGFGTVVHGLSGLTDAFSILMISLLFYAYLKRNLMIFISLILLSIFQREMIFFFFSVVAMGGILFSKDKRYEWLILALSVMGFVIYYILLNTIFYTGTYDEVLSIKAFSAGLREIFTSPPSFTQIFLTQNILILYGSLIAYKKIKKLPISKHHLITVVMLVTIVTGIIVILRIGNNGGRILFMFTPMVLYYIAMELYPVLIKPGNAHA